MEEKKDEIKDEKVEEKKVEETAQQQEQGMKPMSGLAVAGLVLGLVAICTVFIPFMGVGSIIIAIVGLILAAVAVKGTNNKGAKRGRGLAIAGLVLCLVTCGIYVCAQAACVSAVNSADDAISATSDAVDELNDLADKLDSKNSDSKANDSSEQTKKQDAAEKLTDGDFSVVKKAKGKLDSVGTLYIKGTLKNNTGKDLSYVQVSFNILDKDGSQIGTALANINHLKAGGTWKYKALGLETDGYKKFEMAEISYW